MDQICKKYEKEKLEIYNGLLVNRIITHYDQNYLILNINFAESYLKCLKLYDKNGIKIDLNSTANLNNCERFLFQKLFDNCIIHTKEDSDKILEEYKNDEKNILKIYYELLSTKTQEINNLQYNNEYNMNSQEYNQNILHSSEAQELNSINEDIKSENSSVVNNSNNIISRFRHVREDDQKEIIPYKIFPENIDINNYNIIIENNKIVNIQSKTDENLSIIFETKLVKEGSSNKFKGLVSTSILKVFTSMFNKDIVNIIHIHLNDTSEEISVDSLFLEKSEMTSDHKNFKLDAFGKKLNYKFLFRDFKVNLF